MLKATVSQNPDVQVQHKASSLEVERYQSIAEASCEVYEALKKACTKHTEHQAHFCMVVEQGLGKEPQSLQFKFSMAFTHRHLTGSANQSDLLWFVVNSIIRGALETDAEDVKFGVEDSLAQSRKRQIVPTITAPSKKAKKTVRFQSTAPKPVPRLTDTPVPRDSNDSTRNDFCDYLRRCSRQSTHESTCVCVLETTRSCKNFVYPLSTASCSKLRGATSLAQLISTVSRQTTTGKIPLFERVRLAKTLAIAVLQYHATPWLTVSWRSEDVYFFGLEGESSPQIIKSLSSPYLNVKINESNGQLPRASTFPPFRLDRNNLLFSLAVGFLEIAHSSTLETFQRPFDLINGQEDVYTEFFVARRLARSEFSDLGPRYHKIVERLVECDFGCGDDLSSHKLQVAIHNEVICPLEQLEQALCKLNLGP